MAAFPTISQYTTVRVCDCRESVEGVGEGGSGEFVISKATSPNVWSSEEGWLGDTSSLLGNWLLGNGLLSDK